MLCFRQNCALSSSTDGEVNSRMISESHVCDDDISDDVSVRAESLARPAYVPSYGLITARTS